MNAAFLAASLSISFSRISGAWLSTNCTRASHRAMKRRAPPVRCCFCRVRRRAPERPPSPFRCPAQVWRDRMCGVAGQDDATLVPGGGQRDLLQGSPVDVAGLADRVADCADEAAEASEAFAELLMYCATYRGYSRPSFPANPVRALAGPVPAIRSTSSRRRSRPASRCGQPRRLASAARGQPQPYEQHHTTALKMRAGNGLRPAMTEPRQPHRFLADSTAAWTGWRKADSNRVMRVTDRGIAGPARWRQSIRPSGTHHDSANEAS